MTEENPGWGYGCIYGELKELKYDVSWQTVRRVMLDHGLLPDPDKPYRTTWKAFLQSHWECITACGFFRRGVGSARPDPLPRLLRD